MLLHSNELLLKLVFRLLVTSEAVVVDRVHNHARAPLGANFLHQTYILFIVRNG